jgi:hypothetical protein
MDAPLEMDGWRCRRPRDAAREGDHREGRCHARRPEAPELAPVLRIRESHDGKDGVAEDLREQPGAPEEHQRRDERRLDPRDTSERHHGGEFRRRDRDGGPAGLVGKEPMPDGGVGDEPDAHHERGEPERPPLPKERGRDRGGEKRRERRDDPRLEPASQRVRHALTLERKRRAA